MTTETTSLASPEQLMSWLENYDSDIDCRMRANAVLPGAGHLVEQLKSVRACLDRIPTPEQLHLQTRAAEDAAETLETNTRALEAAQAAYRRAKADHERAAADAIRSRKAFMVLERQFQDCGVNSALAMKLTQSELEKRDITIEHGRLVLPVDADWKKYTT